MSARWSFFTRAALIALPVVGSPFSLSNSRPEPRGVGLRKTAADTIACVSHDASTRSTSAGLICTVSHGRHFVCPSCGGNLGTQPGVPCPACKPAGV